jgi:hypothetical protein
VRSSLKRKCKIANASILGALSIFLAISPVLYRTYHDGLTSVRHDLAENLNSGGVNRWIAGKSFVGRSFPFFKMGGVRASPDSDPISSQRRAEIGAGLTGVGGASDGCPSDLRSTLRIAREVVRSPHVVRSSIRFKLIAGRVIWNSLAIFSLISRKGFVFLRSAFRRARAACSLGFGTSRFSTTS